MVGVVDYGMGNLLSVKNALDYLGEDCRICSSPDHLSEVDKIILPGVGAFPDCMKNLHEQDFVQALNKNVLEEKKPVLGICLGMQVMAALGREMEDTPGLGWFEAEVVKMNPGEKKIKIPNVGWENINYRTNSALLQGFFRNPDFYFVHSYYMQCKNEEDVSSWYQLGELKVTASVHRDHIFGTQFHPEKSSDFGREVLMNFVDY